MSDYIIRQHYTVLNHEGIPSRSVTKYALPIMKDIKTESCSVYAIVMTGVTNSYEPACPVTKSFISCHVTGLVIKRQEILVALSYTEELRCRGRKIRGGFVSQHLYYTNCLLVHDLKRLNVDFDLVGI